MLTSVVGFRVRVKTIILIKMDMVMMEMMKNKNMREIMCMLRSIAGWGVVPRMAPPPSQGVQR